jgi:hypothetical protein
MRNNYLNIQRIIIMICLLVGTLSFSQVGIGTVTPASSAMLDIESTTKGVLMPRMTTAQRDNILLPVEGLQIYNTTNKTTDVYTGSIWKSFTTTTDSNLVYVYSLSDLPSPVSNGITLDSTKMYIFSGMVDISPNYIVINGAGLKGTDPQKDGVMSSVSGAVLRSTNTSIFMTNFTVIPFGGSTKAYDFSDSTGTKYCNLFSACSVVQIIPSLGVGQISGFKAVTLIQNFWNVSDGLKITGTTGKFCASYCFLEGITSGSGFEFLAGLSADDIDMANNYFTYTGQTGIKVNAGSTVDRAILTANMFRNVGTPLTGVDSFTPGWRMQQNTNIPDSRAFSFLYVNNNLTATTLTTPGVFYKIAGATTTVNQKRFTGSNNRITYIGRTNIVGKVSVVIGAKAPANNSDFSIGIAKNGTIISAPIASMAASSNNQAFQIVLNTELDLTTNDYIEVFITTNNSNTSSLAVNEMQFRVTD